MPIPLLLRALPLSFRTFRSYVYLLPLTVVSFPFVSGVRSVLGGLAPRFVLFVGLQGALQARGHLSDVCLDRALEKATDFWLVALVFSTLTTVAAIAVGYGVAYVVTGGEMTTASIGPNLLLIGIFVLALAAAKGLCAIAMTVPMTAAAASDRATDTGWFFGFGAGIASLFLTRTLAVVLHFALVLGLTAAVVETVNGKMGAPDWTSLGPIFLALYLVAAWASSWFLGTAVLAWECAVKRNAATEDTRGSRRPDAAWFRALRESRQRRA